MSETDPALDPAQRALPWLLLLPLFVLAWPVPSLFGGDPLTTELSALGVATLALLPLAGWCLWKRPRPSRGSTLLFIALFLPANFGQRTDSLELDRGLLTFLMCFLVSNGAAQLSAHGREMIVRGAAALAVLLLLPALLDGAGGWGGVLGNSGELSGAALPGALCGAALWTRSAGKWQWLGMTAVGLFLMHAVLAPVIAGLMSIVVVLPIALLLMRGAGSTFLMKTVGLLLLAFAGFAWITWGAEPKTAEPVEAGQAVAEAPDNFGGFEVRRLIWGSSFSLIADNPFLGTGLGQFSARFPEYRDARERELSNHNHTASWTTEVEHPHNDWLLPWVEGGAISGLAWWVLFYLILQAGTRALGRPHTTSAAMGAATVGGLLAAGLNAPLLYNPTASIGMFMMFGALLGPGKPVPPELKGRAPFGPLLTIGMVLLLLLNVPRAYGMIQHGAALAEMANSDTDTERQEAIVNAAAILEDSVTARSLAARVLEQRDGDLDGALAHWNRVLQLRPLRFDARMQSGVLLARMGDTAAAQDAFDKAIHLDPTHPGLLRNRVRLFVESEQLERGLKEFERLVELGHFDATWLMRLGSEELLRGRIEAGQTLLARADKRFEISIAEEAYALESTYRGNGSPLVADGFKTLANVLWARAHAAEGKWSDAKRSYFQALRIQRDYVKPSGGINTRVEHACAIWMNGDREEASQGIEDIDLGELNLAMFPEWSREAIFGMIESRA
jgi:O-antigen ligase/tetratricopeptide (TPR) repeat protein